MSIDERLDQTRTLSDGTEMPLLGLGVWQVEDGPTARPRCAGRSRPATG